MSVEAIGWAFKCKTVTDTIEAFVLVKMADAADDYGVFWAKQTTLAEMCRCSRRKVASSIKALEERGLILQLHRRRSDGSKRESAFILIGFNGRKRLAKPEEHPVLELLYVAGTPLGDAIKVHVVHPATECTPCMGVVHPVQEGHARGAHPLKDEPSLEPSLEPPPQAPQGAGWRIDPAIEEGGPAAAARGDEETPDQHRFETVWTAFAPPPTESRHRAERAWRRVDEDERAAAASAATGYVAACEREKRRRPSVATYLSERRWLDMARARAGDAQRVDTAGERVFIEEGTRAWSIVTARRGGRAPTFTSADNGNRIGWYFQRGEVLAAGLAPAGPAIVKEAR